MGMNTDTGELYTFDTKQSLIEAQEKADQRIIEISRKEYESLGLFPAEQRPQIQKDLVSKNHSAKRRAMKKIAKASKQRNRR